MNDANAVHCDDTLQHLATHYKTRQHLQNIQMNNANAVHCDDTLQNRGFLGGLFNIV